MNRAAFTLIEVLISLAVAVTLTVLATTSFFQVQKLVRRAELRLDMHNSMRYLQATASEDVSDLLNGCAVFLTAKASTAAPGEKPNATVSLVFVRGRQSPQDFPLTEQYGLYLRKCSDLSWVEWRWDQRQQVLKRGMNQRVRGFTAGKAWAAPDGNGSMRDLQTRRFYQLPQPWRSADADVDAVLDRNRWGTGDATDLGDRQDLEQQLSPVLQRVSSCAIQLVLADGTMVDADGAVDRATGIDGLFVDGSVPAVAPPSQRRPVLVRLRIELSDATSGLVQTFSCSLQPPGLLPALPL